MSVNRASDTVIGSLDLRQSEVGQKTHKHPDAYARRPLGKNFCVSRRDLRAYILL
jgi:hypothetical protein